MRPRTKQQVIKYLRQKGFPEEGIAETVAELEEYKYIDDFSYSVMYFRYGFEKGRDLTSSIWPTRSWKRSPINMRRRER